MGHDVSIPLLCMPPILAIKKIGALGNLLIKVTMSMDSDPVSQWRHLIPSSDPFSDMLLFTVAQSQRQVGATTAAYMPRNDAKKLLVSHTCCCLIR